MAAPGLSATDKAAAVKVEIERLLSLSPGEVRVLWRKRFRKEVPHALASQLLARMLAWKVQEEAFGGHDAATLKLLKAFAGQDVAKVVLFRKLKPGSTVVREYQGVRHIVTITEGGFVWEGRTYSSLSAIALAITGAKWNGPRFFGLRDPNTGRPARKAS
jgi:hypothetical protein